MTRRLIFTVDVDRDVNFEVEGSSVAGSMDRGDGIKPRFASSERGLDSIVRLLDNIGIKGTFFIEGRTAETIDCSCVSGNCIGFHGYDHENLTKVEDIHDVMARGFEAVKDNVSEPECFRAPYMTIDDRVYDELNVLKVKHDSSVYSDPGVPPYPVKGVIEHPVAKGKDGSGKTIAAYLWPMHEGKRIPKDYIDLAGSMDDGDLVLSTHSWHIVEKREAGLMSGDEVKRNLDNISEVIEGIIDIGFSPSVITG